MGFWNGRVTFTRYRVTGESPLPFGDEVLERVEPAPDRRSRFYRFCRSAWPPAGPAAITCST